MQPEDGLVVEALPARSGWSLRVWSHGDPVAEGIVRVPAGLTWMQQRRAIEERLRSWGFGAPAGSWRRRADGAIRIAATQLGEGSAVSAA